MGRWLLRLIVVGLILFAVSRIISRVLSSDEDFDDFDDLEEGLEFTETPVEIDVPATEVRSSKTLAQTARSESEATTPGQASASTRSADNNNGSTRSVIDVNGIGPTYAARLQDVGITTMEDLAGADAGDLADKIEVIGGRTEIEDWIKQAKGFTTGGATGGE